MNMLFSILANMVECVATIGAGLRSVGMFYEPKVPEELLQKTLNPNTNRINYYLKPAIGTEN